MKWLMCLLVFAGCSGCGFIVAGSIQKRIELLKSQKSAWQTLKNRIHYFADPLNQALIQSAAILPKDTAGLFLELSKRIEKTNDVYTAMQQTLKVIEQSHAVYGCLSKADQQALCSIAQRLGTDSNTQQAAFEWLNGYFDNEIEQGQQRMRPKVRLYRASGALLGLLLVVLFL